MKDAKLSEALMMILIELKRLHWLSTPTEGYSFEVKWLEDYVNHLYDSDAREEKLSGSEA